MTLYYGNYGIFLIMGNAGFISSTVGVSVAPWICLPTFPCSEALYRCLGFSDLAHALL